MYFANVLFFSFTGITTFTNVSFESDIQVGKLNDLDMKLLIPLNAEQIIKVLKCGNVTADELQISGKVNDENLQKIQDNTFMVYFQSINYYSVVCFRKFYFFLIHIYIIP